MLNGMCVARVILTAYRHILAYVSDFNLTLQLLVVVVDRCLQSLYVCNTAHQWNIHNKFFLFVLTHNLHTRITTHAILIA